MKNIIILLFLLLTNNLCNAVDVESLQNQNVLLIYEAKGKSQGSGVIITKKIDKDNISFVLTCAHVVSDAKKTVKYFDVDSKKTLEKIEYDTIQITQEQLNKENATVTITTTGKIVLINEELDLALIKIDNANFTKNTTKFKEDFIGVGEEIWHVGNYSGEFGFNSVAKGIIAKHNRKDNNKLYTQIDITVYKGSSGGGVYDNNNHYVGMVARTHGEHFNMMIPYKTIKQWLNNCGYTFIIDEKAKTPSLIEINNIPIDITTKTEPTLASPIILNIMELLKD